MTVCLVTGLTGGNCQFWEGICRHGSLAGCPHRRLTAVTAKGAAARRQGTKEHTSPYSESATATVLREFLRSAKGAAARRQGRKELASPFGGALDTATVLRVFLRSAKGAAARRQGTKEHTSPYSESDTATVLRVFLKTVSPILKSFLACLMFASLCLCAEAPKSTEAPKSADAVLADYTQAVGGLPAVDAITTRQVTGSRSFLGKVEIYWQKPNKVLMLAGKERTAYNGSAGWFYSKRKHLFRLSNGLQTPIEIDVNPLRYVHLRQMYAEINAAPQKTIDETLMDVLVAPNDLAQTTFYFDAHTHLLARIEEKGETSAYFTRTIWFDDYKPVDKIVFPFHITQQTSDKGGKSEDFKIKNVKNNVEIGADIFNKPDSANLVFGGKR